MSSPICKKQCTSRSDGEEPPAVILVTGGKGLVGKGLEDVIKSDPDAVKEKWIFLSSKDGDLW